MTSISEQVTRGKSMDLGSNDGRKISASQGDSHKDSFVVDAGGVRKAYGKIN